MLDKAGDASGDPCERLSLREAEILEMTSFGLTNSQLAAKLNITTHAVKFHLSSIFRKLGVGNRTEAVALYLRRPNG